MTPPGRNPDLAWRRRPPLSTFSLFVSNLPSAISKVELEAMFVRAVKVTDSFIPTDCSSGKQRGFDFIRLKTEREALLGLELANGRSWGGRRILVDLARPRSENPPYSATANKPPSTWTLDWPPPSFSGSVNNAWAVRLPPLGPSGSSAGWIVRDGGNNYIRVAPWVVEMEKKTLWLIGFLKPNQGLTDAALWLHSIWGRSKACLK